MSKVQYGKCCICHTCYVEIDSNQVLNSIVTSHLLRYNLFLIDNRAKFDWKSRIWCGGEPELDLKHVINKVV